MLHMHTTEFRPPERYTTFKGQTYKQNMEASEISKVEDESKKSISYSVAYEARGEYPK